MPSNSLVAPWPSPSGLAMVVSCDQVVPSQCMTWFRNVSVGVTAPSVPAAQQLLAPVQARAVSSLKSPVAVPPGLGTVSVDHVVPFQRSASLWVVNTLPLVPKVPTARQLDSAVQRTLPSPWKAPALVPAGWGVAATSDHLAPFHRSS